MKKLLIMVISVDDGGIYSQLMRKSIETWDSFHVPGVSTVFYCGKSTKRSTGKVLYTDAAEGLFNMGHKNISAFRHVLNAGIEFDYVLRVNASAYVNKRVAIDWVQSLPESRLVLGLRVPIVLYDKPTEYLWGPAFVLSRDMVRLVVQRADAWNHKYIEDVAISQFFISLGIELNGNGRLATVNWNDGGWLVLWYKDRTQGGHRISSLSELGTLDFPVIRVKQDGKRHQDLEIMDEIFKAQKP